tara:strand:- start:4631 stop:4942 length:312 start_codon:yes stop_codon:yes gene_type:complete
MSEYEDIAEEGFWFEMQEIALAVTEIVKRYDMQDKVMSAFVMGVLKPLDEENSTMKAFFQYDLRTTTELEIIVDFMKESYIEPESDDDFDIDGLLDGLGISLN